MIFFGILMLTRTYFEYDENSLKFYAILGPAKTIYNYSSFKDFELEGKKIFVKQGDTRKKVRVSAFNADKEGWQAFLDKITIK